MKQFLTAALLACLPIAATAEAPAAPRDLTQRIVTDQILPAYAALSARSLDLAEVAQADCTPASEALRSAYGAAFDAWVAVSHLRFGPSEVEDRAFALAFWPDSRGKTPKALANLISAEDAAGRSTAAFTEVSIAARGFYALEFLLFDEAFQTMGSAEYRCALLRTMTADIAALGGAIEADWTDGYADTLLSPHADGRYHSDEEALQELFKALTTGLQFTADTRLGRPMGTYDRPRPNRAEARRSLRSARHVALSLAALRPLALTLASGDTALQAEIANRFDKAEGAIAALDDPAFAGVATPAGRFKVELVLQAVTELRETVVNDLGPALGVAGGFNALDGD